MTDSASSMLEPEAVLNYVRQIDALRLEQACREYGARRGGVFGAALAAAFPPLAPGLGWQLDLLARLEEEGLHVPRRVAGQKARLLESMRSEELLSGRLRQLRRGVWAEKARIALRELLPSRLGGGGIQTTARELSNLAEALLGIVLSLSVESLEGRAQAPRLESGAASELVVLGMGKLGGEELNAGSDIDLVFFYDTDDTEGPVSAHEYWSLVVQRLVAMLDESTADGRLWRVDLRLRPEGSSGPVVNSLAAAERYYETWGRFWERSALLRSRAVAGSKALGRVLEREVITPFVYRSEVDPGLPMLLAELVQRARVELCRHPERDLKLGPGGIREAEFFIQALQLVWGGKEPSLRVAGSLPGLERLNALGLVSEREAGQVGQAYRFLRLVEHRVQWMSGVQTHLLPEPGEDLERLARSLELDTEGLLSRLAEHRGVVEACSRSLVPGEVRPVPQFAELFSLLDERSPELAEYCAQRFGEAELGLHLLALARRPDGLLGELTRERLSELSDQVLDALAQSGEPLQAAVFLRSVFGRLKSPLSYLQNLQPEPLSMRRLVQVLGASQLVGDAIVAHPDLADVVLLGGGAVTDPQRTVRAELEQVLASSPSPQTPTERRALVTRALRLAKQRTTVEVAVADLGDRLSRSEVAATLSDLADAALACALSTELGQAPRGLSVLALGKLGGKELGYGSDLDIAFVFDPAEAPAGVDAAEHFTALAQRVIRLLSDADPAGRGYQLDTRLRPSGEKGLLVTSLSAFARYHGVPLQPGQVATVSPAVLSSGAPWERQTLLRARYAAGDEKLGQRALAVAQKAAYGKGAPEAAELHRLRLRLQHELGRESQHAYDFKLGEGGMLDVEFAVQWLQMKHGEDPEVRHTNTEAALEALASRGYLALGLYETLREGYRFLRRLEQRSHIQNGLGTTRFSPEDPERLGALAHWLGFGPRRSPGAAADFLASYRAVTASLRAAYLEVLAADKASAASSAP
jgi:glutamate-ammonia-ligase adenylyltransferase